MSIAALSPVAPEPPSPMVTSVTPVTPTLDSSGSARALLSQDLEHQFQAGASSPGGEGGGEGGGGASPAQDSCRRSQKPPPLHTSADWKVVLHLPEIETWLRLTSERVTQLTHSAATDTDNRHVDAHLVQLKDICEDISDHVEQIHALLETEFSLKLLSYSVNIIVDIRTVQLLWHQLRVSVLVLKERLLQGLQDSNGNFTRQTDILQAFSQDQHQTRLDALTEVDDCGQLTIRCSQDYFSLDCGITAFELSDYSPGDEPEEALTDNKEDSVEQEPGGDCGSVETERPSLSNQDVRSTSPDLATAASDQTNLNHSPPPLLPIMQCGSLSHSEGGKRPLRGVSHSTEVSPTRPSLPKRDRRSRGQESTGGSDAADPLSGLQLQAELSRSSPSLMDPPDRSKFWLELESVYPEDVSQSYESLQLMNRRNLQRNTPRSRRGAGRSEGSERRTLADHRSSSVDAHASADAPRREGTSQMKKRQEETRTHSEGDSDSSLPSPRKEQFLLSSDPEGSAEESDPRPPPSTTAAVWIVQRHGQKQGAQLSEREHWYGSEEFLALPAQLRQTEILAVKLERLAQSIPLRPADCQQEALQDVDDWDLTELNPDWDVTDNVSSVADSGDDGPSPLPALLPSRRHPLARFSPTSSSDIAPSVGESIESGPLSELQSEEDEGRASSADGCPRAAAPPVDGRGGVGVSLVQELLEDIQNQDRDPDVWGKIECFVQQLDGFISWLQEALGSTENWTQPRQDLDSLRAYLDTHLSFKVDVDGHCALKENIMEEGRELLTIITSNQSGLKEILHMVTGQWDQLQRQIRRQHGWMLRALRCVQSRLLYSSQSQESVTLSADGLKVELISGQRDAQRAALEQMAVKLSGLRYPTPASRRQCSQPVRNSSLQDFETEYQELWDWLMDMDAMVMDSHHLLMSEEQRRHLFKSSHSELMMMENRKSNLLGRAESLKRSGVPLPSNFHSRIHNLTHTWTQLEKILAMRPGPGSHQHGANTLTVGDGGGAGGVATTASENPRSALSPLTNSLLEQLETRIKELKAWLRDTELLIFNSCLRNDKDANDQLQSFKSLCAEVRARRRGVSSVLKLCQKLLQSQTSPTAEAAGPEAEQHQEALQLLSINLERRWEAIVMQALQWQNRLKRELGERQVPGNFLEPGLVDLHHISPVPVGPVAPTLDDSWEWDETDMTITEVEPQGVPEPDLMQDLPEEPDIPLDGGSSDRDTSAEVPADQSLRESSLGSMVPNTNNNVYQVYCLHNVEFYRQPQFPSSSSSSLHSTRAGRQKQHLLLKSLSKDSSFSSIESLPDLLGGLTSNNRRGGSGDGTTGLRDGDSEKEGRGSGQSVNSRRSECESGIVSDTGDTETTTNSETQEEEAERKRNEGHQEIRMEANKREKGWRRDERKRPRRGPGEAIEILVNGHGILTPADSDSDFEVEGVAIDPSRAFIPQGDIPGIKDQFHSEEGPDMTQQVSSPVLSQGSSLESLLAPGVELFPSKDLLHRSASLESCLLPCRSSRSSLAEVDEGHQAELVNPQKEPSAGELSRRTLDLLKRLENIQSPLTTKMTRSVSEMMLRSSSPPQRRRLLTASSSFGGRHTSLYGISGSLSRKGPPSLINESSATASLTELSSAEDSSMGSEDFAAVRNRRRHLLAAGTNAGSSRRQLRHQGLEEADGASLSMVVNVSACTDEDEDDSDLLSSSTLTLTEEELGVREGEDEEEERLSGASSGNEDDEDEEEMEGSYVLGLDYIKNELQSWIRSPRTTLKSELGLHGELQCGPHMTSFTSSSSSKNCFLNRSSAKFVESSSNKARNGEEQNQGNSTRSYMSQFVDDVENGNVEQCCRRGKDDEDDEFLREESSVFTNKRESPRESYVFVKDEESLQDVDGVKPEVNIVTPPSLSQRRGYSLVGQLRGELPCHTTSFPSPPSLSPVDDCRSHDALHSGGAGTRGRKAITSQEKFKFSSLVTEETRREVRDKESSLPPKKQQSGCDASCQHHPHSSSSSSSSSLRPASAEEEKKENVHDFVMEIIDLTSVALKSKDNLRESVTKQPETSGSNADQAPLSHIRDKVLEHSHRPLHLRKGDFYAYLSLSSHDSDCGEVTQCPEDKSSTPAPYTIPTYTSPTQGLHSPSPELFTSTNRRTLSTSSPPSWSFAKASATRSSSLPSSPDIRDEETLFAACTEEVYLGPPLCYSMVLPRRSRTFSNAPELQSKQGDSLSRLTPSEESVLDQELLYFQGSSPTARREEASPLLDSYRCSPTPVDPSPPLAVSSRRVRDPNVLRDVAASEVASQRQESRNEGPPYLNPCHSSSSSSSSSCSTAAACSADTKTPESDTDAVMTEISVGGTATNPSKEPAAAATHINPKINRSPIAGADREEGRGRRGGEAAETGARRGRSGSQQEVKTLAAGHVTRTEWAGQRRSQIPLRHAPSSGTGTNRRLPVVGAGTSRIHL